MEGVRNSQKNGFLRYLLETSAFYMLKTVCALHAYVGLLRYLPETSAFYMLRTVYSLFKVLMQRNFRMSLFSLM